MANKDYLLKYLMLKLAPVLVKVKPSNLFAICNCEKSGNGAYYYLWEKYKGYLARALNISFKELRRTRCGGVQVLFYDYHELSELLGQTKNSAYLGEHGYSSCVSLKDYLDVLSTRFNSGSFPHEIGIFLGYPIKDVKGFMQGKARWTYINRWQVFGKPEKSIRLMQIHKKAEEVIMKLVVKHENPLNFIERLSGHFRKHAHNVMTVSA